MLYPNWNGFCVSSLVSSFDSFTRAFLHSLLGISVNLHDNTSRSWVGSSAPWTRCHDNTCYLSSDCKLVFRAPRKRSTYLYPHWLLCPLAKTSAGCGERKRSSHLCSPRLSSHSSSLRPNHTTLALRLRCLQQLHRSQITYPQHTSSLRETVNNALAHSRLGQLVETTRGPGQRRSHVVGGRLCILLVRVLPLESLWTCRPLQPLIIRVIRLVVEE